MTQIASIVPNLVGGVSQQADDLRYPSQVEEQINAYPSVVDGLVKRAPSEHVAHLKPDSVHNATGFYYLINRDENERFYLSITNGASPQVHVFNLDTGASVPVLDADGDPLGSLPYFVCPNPAQDLRALTVADYTFLLNTKKTVAARSNLSPSTPPSALVFVKNVRRGTDYTIKLYNSPTGSSPNYTVTMANVDLDQDRDPASGDPIVNAQEDVTTYLRAQLNAAGASSTYNYTSSGGVMRIRKDDGSDFRVEVDCTLNEGMFVFKDTCQNFSLLPKIGYAGFRILVAGDPDQDEDDYYLTYEADVEGVSGFTPGVWRETAKGGETYRLNEDTMPWALQNYGTHFRLVPLTWGRRNAGDSESNPMPSFVGNKITALGFFKNRLAFATDESVVLSRAGEFFDFFRSTVRQLLDEDVIDTATTHTKVSIINDLLVVSEKLLLFSTQTQFTFSGGDLLTPGTASATVSNDYSVSKLARPVALGDAAYFAFDRGTYSGVMEYRIRPDTGLFAGEDITGHVPRYLQGKITGFTGNYNEGVLIALTGQPEFYLYRFYNKGDQRVQSAWCKWDVGGIVRKADMIDTVLHLLVEREDGLFLERIDLASGLRDPHADYTVRLDRRLSDVWCGKAYNPTYETTEILLPYEPDPEKTEVVTRFTGSTGGGFRLTPLDVTGNTVTVPGDLTGVPFWIGENYTETVVLTRPTIKEDRGSGAVTLLNGRFQVTRGELAYDDSLYFRVEITPRYRDTRVAVFDNRTLNVGNLVIGEPSGLADGVLGFGVYADAKDVKVTLVNDSPYPSSFLNLEWLGRYNTRRQRA